MYSSYFPLTPHINHYVISSPFFFFSSYRNIAIPRVQIRQNQAHAMPDLLTLAIFSSKNHSHHLCIMQSLGVIGYPSSFMSYSSTGCKINRYKTVKVMAKICLRSSSDLCIFHSSNCCVDFLSIPPSGTGGRCMVAVALGWSDVGNYKERSRAERTQKKSILTM